MEHKWKSISEEKPAYYKTVLISDDEGETFIQAYLVYSENKGYLWIECGKTCEDDTDFHFLYEYPYWTYEG